MHSQSSKPKPSKQAPLTKGQILGALPKLSRDDLLSVHAVASSLLGAAVGGLAAPADPVAEPVFDALAAALGLSGPLSFMPEALAKRFNKQLPHFTKFLDKACPGWNKHKVRQTAFLRFMFQILKDDLLRIKIQPTYSTMINNLHRMPEVYDNAFPGYMEAGLGNLILRQFGVAGADAPASKPLPKRKALVAKAKPKRAKDLDT